MEVVWLLDGDTLASLRRALQPPAVAVDGSRKRARIPLEAFVAEIYRAICLRHSADHEYFGRNQTETRQLVERTCILFDLVDIDSVGVVDWEHFTDFCVYMRGRDSGDQGQEQDEPGAHEGGGGSQPDEITRFVEKLGYTDRSSHCHEIRSMRFVKGLDLLVVVEGTAILKIYSSGPHKIGQIEPAIAMRKLMIDTKRSGRAAAPKGKSRGGGSSARGGGASATSAVTEESLAVLAMEYIGRVNQAAVSCADGYLTVWDLESFKLLRYVRLRDVQVGLRFCPAMGVLASWGVDEFNHEIIVWDVDRLAVLRVLDGHSEAVKDIYEVAPATKVAELEDTERNWEPMLATAGMDRKVVLWDLRIGFEGSLEPRKLVVLVGHYHGVLSLTYSSEHDLILSAGFDFDANCWDRGTSHLHMKLVGHRVSLIGVVIVEHETQRAVTGDEGGSFRVWDIQRGHSDHGTCLQSFSLRNARVLPRSMAVVWNEGLVVAGSKMHIFRAAPSVPVEASPLGIWFSSYTGELCVVLREAVVFDAATGSIKRRICQQTHGCEITAFCMDARHKRSVVGDQRGGLRVYDGITGRWIMSANPHRSEVSALLFIDEDNAFISAGWDGMIQIHDARVCSLSATRSKTSSRRSGGEQVPIGHRCAFALRSVVNAHDGDITLMAASARLGLIATASSDLTVRLWDYQLLRLEDIIVAHRQEITCVRFLDPLPCLATADMTGKVLLWATRPHPNGGALLMVIRNTVIAAGGAVTEVAPGLSGRRLARARGARTVLPTPVTCIAFRHRKPPESDPTGTETAAASQRATQNQKTALELKVATTAAEGEGSDRQDETASSTTVSAEVPATPSPWEFGSILFTGDELGSIKVWDLTDVLLEKLGPTAGGAKEAEEDKAAIPPASFGAVSHHFIHYRQGPLDGVGLQAAVRFRELIDIARVLRRGEHLQTAKKPESDQQVGLDRCGGRAVLVGGGKKARRRFSEAKSSTGSLSSGGTTTPRSRDRSPARRRKKQECDQDPRGQAGGSGSSNASLVSKTAPDAASDAKRRARGPGRAKEQAEATLNARPDDIHPVASWTGHKDCVTSMEIVSSPLSIVTGSLDSSARLFSLGGSLLGVMSEKQNNVRGPERAWAFQPPRKGRDTEASAKAVALEITLKHVRHEERQPVVRPGISGIEATTARDNTPGQGRCTLSSAAMGKAPNNGSELGPTLDRASPPPGAGVDRACRLAGDAGDNGVEEKGGEGTSESRDCLQAQSAVSAACLARINELNLSQGRAAEATTASSDTGSDSLLRTADDGIEARLLSEAREGWEHQRRRGVCTGQASSGDNQDQQRTGYHHTAAKASGVALASEQPPPPKLPPNLSAECERKQARRTRSTLDFLSNNLTRTSGGGAASASSSFTPPMIKSQSQNNVGEGPRVTGRTQGSRPFTSPGPRAKSPDKKEYKFLARHDSATTLLEPTGLSPAAKLRHAVLVASPYLSMRLEGKKRKKSPRSSERGREGKQADVDGGRAGRGGAGEESRAGGVPPRNERAERGGTTPSVKLAAMPVAHGSSATNMLFTQRSAMTLLSVRSNRSNTSCLPTATRAAGMSTKVAVARRMAADRRLRRMDGILDGVRRLGKRETVGSSQRNLLSRAADGDQARPTVAEEAAAAGESEEAAKASEREAAAGTLVLVSARVREVLSRFESSVNGREDDQDDEFDNQADQRAKSMRRQLEARTATRQEAIRHNERYRRAQRYNLVTLQETQLRRQEAMVGLAGPSGERFGPYTLDDVLEFRVFANNLTLPGAEQLTLRGLVENADVQADPYSQALLQGLVKSGVLQWNQSLSLEDLMQLVFHFAKHEEAKRMVAAMDIALLLERLRDAFLADKSSLVGRNGSLPFNFMNDIDMAFRTTGAEACGTCTLKELYGIMIRVGSDLFPSGQENLEALAAQCGIMDGHSELTADNFKALLTKLVSLHHHQHQGGDHP